jgi:flavocytochrome c
MKKMSRILGGILLAAVLLLGCTNAPAKRATGTGQQQLVDGVYTGSATGHNGPVKISVTVRDGTIAAMNLDQSAETLAIGTEAFEIIKAAVLETQSLAVDSITGATVSRAAFLQAAGEALSQAGADTSAMQRVTKEAPVPQNITWDTDVLVIGAGAAGLAAALEAGNAGLKVIVLEKNSVLGGTTARCAGIIQAADTFFQRENGVTDAVDAMFRGMRSVQTDTNIDPEMVKFAVNESPDLIRWLADNGVAFDHLEVVHTLPPRNVPRAHHVVGMGGGLVQYLTAKLKSLNVEFYTNTRATEILKNGGRVTGAKAINRNGDTITVNAKAVILAAGGYSSNRELMAELNPNIRNYTTLNSNTGDGYTLAKRAGAEMIVRPDGVYQYSQQLPGIAVGTNAVGYYTPEVIEITPDGKRYANEELYTFDRSGIVYKLGFDTVYGILPNAFYSKDPEAVIKGVERDIVIRAASIELLAEKIGVDPGTLRETITRYNGFCDAKNDADFKKNPEFLQRIDGPIYYAMLLPPNVSDTYNGAKINIHSQVIGVNGQPIPGFYAAGACAMARVIDQHYFGSGTAILMSLVYGREAARHAASVILNQ